MHTGYYFGTFLAAIVNYTVGAHYGWRAVFAVGGTPALLVAFIRYGVRESKRWEHRVARLERRWTARDAFFALFSAGVSQAHAGQRDAALHLDGRAVGGVGLRAFVGHLPRGPRRLQRRRTRRASHPGPPCCSPPAPSWAACMLPPLAERLGRRGALAFYFVLMFVFIALGFGYVFYRSEHALPWFMTCLFFLGVGGANFAVYTLWLPEQYRTECRGSAFAFATSFGRFLAAGHHLPGRRRSGADAHHRHARGAHFASPFWSGWRCCRSPWRPKARSCPRESHASLRSLAHRPPRRRRARIRGPHASPSARSTRAAIAWRTCCSRRGLKTGDRLCCYLANCVEMIDLYLACIKLGVIFVPINILYRDREIAHILQRRRARRDRRRRRRSPPRAHLASRRSHAEAAALPDARPRSRSMATRPRASSTPPAPPARRRARCSRTTTSRPTRSRC